MRKLYGPVLARVGWTPRRGEPGKQTQFRAWLVRYLSIEANDRTVLNRAASLGRAYLGTDGRLHPEAVDQDLVGVALEAAGRTGDAALFQTLLQRLKAADDSNVREGLLVGLGQFPDPALAEQARMLAMQEGLRVNERGYVLGVQAVTLEQRPGAWSWLQTNVDDYAPRMPETYVQFFAYAQDGCSEADAQGPAERPRSTHRPFAGATYTLNKVVEKTRLCGALADRQRESARQFFGRTPRRLPAQPGR